MESRDVGRLRFLAAAHARDAVLLSSSSPALARSLTFIFKFGCALSAWLCLKLPGWLVFALNTPVRDIRSPNNGRVFARKGLTRSTIATRTLSRRTVVTVAILLTCAWHTRMAIAQDVGNPSGRQYMSWGPLPDGWSAHCFKIINGAIEPIAAPSKGRVFPSYFPQGLAVATFDFGDLPDGCSVYVDSTSRSSLDEVLQSNIGPDCPILIPTHETRFHGYRAFEIEWREQLNFGLDFYRTQKGGILFHEFFHRWVIEVDAVNHYWICITAVFAGIGNYAEAFEHAMASKPAVMKNVEALIDTFKFGVTGDGASTDQTSTKVVVGTGTGSEDVVAAVAKAIAALVVTALAVKAVAVGLGKVLNSGKPKPPEEPSKKKPDPGPVGYILQISADCIKLDSQASQSFSARVLAVNAQGGYAPASDVAIQILAPPDAGFLSVTPSAGSGQLQATLSLAQPPTTSEVELQVYAATKGGGKTAKVRVLCESQFAAYVNGAKQASARYDTATKSWKFFDVIAGFWFGGDKTPVKPGFDYALPSPPFTAVPDILALDEPVYSDDQGRLIYKFSLKPGIDLEQEFGPDLKTQHNGQVHVKVQVVDQKSGQTWQDEIVYKITPELVPMAWCFGKDVKERDETRQYRDGLLDEYQIVADGKDELKVAMIFVPSHKVEDRTDPTQYLDKAIEGIKIDKIDLVGEGSQQFTAEEESECTTINELTIKSKSLILLTPAADHLRPALIVEGSLTGPQAGQFEPSGISFRIDLKVLPVFMKLLVLPGCHPGTSLAVFYTGTVSPNGEPSPLSGTKARIETICYGSPWLSVDEPVDGITNPHGVAKWTVRYHNMTWKNKTEANFKVRVGITDPDDPPFQATAVTIDVNANGAKYLEAFGQAAPTLDLSHPFLRYIPVHPDFLYGPINNVLSFVSERFGPYTCGDLRDKIWKWTFSRRHSYDPDLAASMNGLDFFKYWLKPLHVFFGFTLAGTEDPYFIDPWWREIYEPDEAIKTWTKELEYLAGTCAVSTLVLAHFVCSCGIAVGGVALTMPEATALVAKLFAVTGAVGEPVLEYKGVGFRVGKDDGLGWLVNGKYSDAPACWGDDFFLPLTKSGTSKIGGPPDYRQNCRGHVEGLEPW